MAGIGFELIKMIKKDSYTSLAKAYGLTTLMISGPYLFILLTMTTLYFFALFSASDIKVIYQFNAIIVYIVLCSIVLSSFLQLTFFRYVADRIFKKEFSKITPNYIGVLFAQLIISLVFSFLAVFYFFPRYSLLLDIIFISTIVILSMIFIAIVLLTGIKSYRRIIASFLLAYCVLLIINSLIHDNTLIYLLIEFLITQVFIFLLLCSAILRQFPTSGIIEFDFFKKGNLYYLVGFANLFYTLGFWVDKTLFWFNPSTSYVSFAPLRYSPIYDFPMLIAYLTVIPTTTSFLLQIETTFSMIYPKFMIRIFKKKSLSDIDAVRNELAMAGRNTIYNLFKTQAVIIVAMFLITPYLLTILKLPMIYIHLLYILYIAAGLNVILWGLLSIFYYTTRYSQACCVSLLFFLTNFSFTLLSLHLGPVFFGYGFAFSLLISIALALYFLNGIFKDLTYTTFMMTD